MKKIITGVICFLAMILLITNVQAQTNTNGTNKIYQGKFNVGLFDKEFKSSVDKAKKALPFFNIATKNMIYDSDVIASGISFGNESIKVDKKLLGVQVLVGGDTITVDGSVEYALILAPNVVINGTVQKDIVIVAESVFVTEKAVIGNDITLACTKAEIKGQIKGNLIGTTANLYLSGEIQKDIRVSSKVFKAEKEKIAGSIYIETDSDMKYIKDKYKDCQIMPFTTAEIKEESNNSKITSYITKGIIIVIIYTLIAYLLTKKENNVIDNMTEKLKAFTPFTFIMGALLIAVIPLAVLLLIILAIYGLGVIAWPILIAYVAFIAIACIIDILVSGLVLANLIIQRIEKDKITLIKKISINAGIFAIIYILTILTEYASMICAILSIGMLFTYMFKNVKNIESVKK